VLSCTPGESSSSPRRPSYPPTRTVRTRWGAEVHSRMRRESAHGSRSSSAPRHMSFLPSFQSVSLPGETHHHRKDLPNLPYVGRPHPRWSGQPVQVRRHDFPNNTLCQTSQNQHRRSDQNEMKAKRG
jgi:hypothetical protein